MPHSSGLPLTGEPVTTATGARYIVREVITATEPYLIAMESERETMEGRLWYSSAFYSPTHGAWFADYFLRTALVGMDRRCIAETQAYVREARRAMPTPYRYLSAPRAIPHPERAAARVGIFLMASAVGWLVAYALVRYAGR